MKNHAYRPLFPWDQEAYTKIRSKVMSKVSKDESFYLLGRLLWKIYINYLNLQELVFIKTD